MGYPAFNLTVEQLSEFENDPRVDSESHPSLSTTALADLIRWRGLPEPMRREILQQMRDHCPADSGVLDGPCTWFDPESRLCIHHEYRPQVCREFQVGNAECLEWRRAKSSWLEDVSLPSDPVG